MGSEDSLSVEHLIDIVTTFFQNKLNKTTNVIGASQLENGWSIEVETIEDSEYLRKRGQDDLVAIYGVEITNSGQIGSFKRKSLRNRGQIDFTKDE